MTTAETELLSRFSSASIERRKRPRGACRRHGVETRIQLSHRRPPRHGVAALAAERRHRHGCADPPGFRHARPPQRAAPRSEQRRARRPDLRDDVLRLSPTPNMPRRCSISSAPATSIAASPIRPSPCSRNASRRSRAASAPWRRRAAWRRCISPSPRWPSAGDHIVALRLALRRNHQSPRPNVAALRHPTTFVKPRDLDGFARRDRPKPAGHRRDHRESGTRSARHPGGRRHRPRGRRPAR